MTIAAVILAASVESALADVEGLPRVRRLVDVAWSGGATPIVVVAPDPDGTVTAALREAPVTLAEPAPVGDGPVAQIARGFDVAVGITSETAGALVWPARMVWVGPETITSLIEAHGASPAAILRPTFEAEAGWPVLVPTAELERLRMMQADRMPAEIIDELVAGGVPEVRIDLGDPGSIHDAAVPRIELPPYVGPPEPAAGHTHEWGEELADSDQGPLAGPGHAPFATSGAGSGRDGGDGGPSGRA
ncbi:MAG: NTP transferase domain-containing protein [Candidatus Limnocylindrales bacterium]